MGQLNFIPDVTQNFRKQFRDAAWRCQDDVAMDAATRSMSTPVGQVENPILNAFDSEYFLGPGKIFYDSLLSYEHGLSFINNVFIGKSNNAVQSKEKT
jgi:hypothetical protein